jgi:signal transduction histidine kinase
VASTQFPGIDPSVAPNTPRTFRPAHSVNRRVIGLLTAFCWSYAISIPVIFELSGKSAEQLVICADWLAVPLQLVALILLSWMVWGRGLASNRQRKVWVLVWAYVALSLISTYVWNWYRPTASTETFSFADALYLIDYWILAAAFGVLFLHTGGSFKSARVWLDAATMLAVQLAGLWWFFLTPSSPPGREQAISPLATGGYSITLAAMLTMGGLLYLECPKFRGRYPIMLLVGAGVATATWEIMWLTSWLADFEFIGAYYNYGDVLSCACIVSAVSAMQYQTSLSPEAADPERRVDSFLPMLGLLLAIAVISANLATTRRLDTWVLVGLVGLCVVLLITRQRRVRKELHMLNRQLAMRVADERLTELVRHSAELIVVVNAARRVTFASPAGESVLSSSSVRAHDLPAEMLFGDAHEAMLSRFLDAVLADKNAPAVLELRVQDLRHAQREAPRTLLINAENQLGNPLINGLVLTIIDVTAQRALEREVLDVATRERVRLCADIHDGLGQELTGIAMLLHVAAKAPDPDAALQRGHLESIVGLVNRTIATARDLARGLSPLHVVRGSLGGALRRLAQESSSTIPIRVEVDRDIEEHVLDDFSADHVYRIAQEAVANSVRHSACENIDIELRHAAGTLVLKITDNGRGIDLHSSNDTGLGLRLMEYRARMIGGSLRCVSTVDGGTRVELTMPMTSQSSASSNAR